MLIINGGSLKVKTELFCDAALAAITRSTTVIIKASA